MQHFSSGLLCYFTGQHLTVSFCCLRKQSGQIVNYTLLLLIMEVENYSKRKETIYWRDPLPTSMMEKECFANPNCKRPFREVASHASSTEEVLLTSSDHTRSQHRTDSLPGNNYHLVCRLEVLGGLQTFTEFSIY